MLGLDKAPVTYSYRCQECWYEEEIEDIVVEGFAVMSELKSGQMPCLVCPKCGSSLYAIVGLNRERSER